VNGTGSRPDGAAPIWPGVVEIWWGTPCCCGGAVGTSAFAAAASSADLQVRPAVSRPDSALVMPVLPLLIWFCASWLSQDVVW